jgi:hypothetical protein
LRGRWLAPLSLLAAELGHLTAAFAEWPTSTARGVLHIAVAALQGLVCAAAFFGPSRVELSVGLAATLLPPVGWLVGTIVGSSPYRAYPLAVAATLSAAEVAAAALLTRSWPPVPPVPQPRRSLRVAERSAPT